MIIIFQDKCCKVCNQLIKKTIEYKFEDNKFKPIWITSECSCISRGLSIEALKSGYNPTLLNNWREHGQR